MTKDSQHGDSSLSDEQIAFLIESGEFTPEELAETQASIARGELAESERRTRQSAVKASLSAEEVATQLGIDVAQVEYRQADGSLFAFTTHGQRRYPTWQFTGDPRQPVLPGLARLVSGFPDDKHPASILGFMSTPQESLRVDDERLTPVEWLLQGGNPQRLVDILESFLQS
jgi:hypothetical protein